MSNDNRKSPFSEIDEGDEQDWDKALNAWEMSDGEEPKKEDEPAAAKPAKPAAPPPPPPRPLPPPAPPAPKRAPIEAPRPGIPTPTAPPPSSSRFGDVPRVSLDHDDEDDATIVARVSPELLADSQGAGGRTSGLEQVLRRAASHPGL